MRVFVTGATGFVGSHLVDMLLQAGHDVWGLVRPNSTRQSALPQHPHFHFIEGELLDLAGIKQIIGRLQPDLIYHLAGQPYPALSWQDPAMTIAVNAGGTANILEGAVGCGDVMPRVVVVTSAEIYGKVRPNQLPLSERSQPKPRHPYGVSKYAAGQLVRVYADRYNLPVVEARPFNHIGPHQALGFVATDFASQIASIKLGLIPPKMKVGNLSAERDFTDVRDVVRAYCMLGEKGTAGESYLICSGQPVAVHTILNILLEINNVYVDLEYDPARMRPSDVPVLYGTYGKISQEVGWQPKIHLRTTLSDISAEWIGRLKQEHRL